MYVYHVALLNGKITELIGTNRNVIIIICIINIILCNDIDIAEWKCDSRRSGITVFIFNFFFFFSRKQTVRVKWSSRVRLFSHDHFYPSKISRLWKFMEHAIYLGLPCVSNFRMMVSMIVVLGATWPRLTGISGTGFSGIWTAETSAFFDRVTLGRNLGPYP